MKKLDNISDFLFYSGADGSIRVEVIIGDETVWLNQKGMAELFDVEIPAISKHVKNIYQEGELQEFGTISKMEIVRMNLC